MKVDQNPIKDPKFEGAYRVAAVSGLLTGVAAGAATTGHLFALRWAPSGTDERRRTTFILQRFRARLATVTGFTAEQEIGLQLFVARAFSATGSGGTAVDLTTSGRKRAGFPNSLVTDMRVANTGALTAGTQTLDSAPIAVASAQELASGATVQRNAAEILMPQEDTVSHPVLLAPNEGLILRNTIAMGAAGTMRLIVEIDWLELERY
jgi:hypothetical protein